jgi:hypothetical protein
MWASDVVPRQGVLDALADLKGTFAARRRLVVEDLLPEEIAEDLAADLRRQTFRPVVNIPLEDGRRPPPRFWHHHAILEVDPRTPRSPVEALVASLTAGPLRDFVARVTGHRELYNHLGRRGRPILVAHAYPRGGYLEEHADDAVDDGSRRAVSLVWHASPRWDADWGGRLRFIGTDDEPLAPRFGALHLFEARSHNRHEVTMVTGPAVRYTLSGWLYERAS